MNYYNENDKLKAAWLRELIACDVISKGEVDERSITEVKSSDLRGYKQCHFFAGIGIWSYALRLAGWPDWREVWTASAPCQPWSVAGEGKGEEDERHLWPVLFRLIAVRRPRVLFGEQVADGDGITWLDTVQTQMESISYRFGPCVLPASGFGAPHGRHRTYFVADTERARRESSEYGGDTRREESERPRLCRTPGHRQIGNVADSSIARERPVAEGPCGQHQPDLGRSDAEISVADTEQVGCGRRSPDADGNFSDGREDRRDKGECDASRRSEVCNLADAESECGHGPMRAWNGDSRPADNGSPLRLDDSTSGGLEGMHGPDQQQQGAGSGREESSMDNTERARLEVRSGQCQDYRASERTSAAAVASGTPGPCNGFWADAEWIPTRGKIPGTVDWRPIKPESLQMDDGTPADLLRMCDYGFPLAEKAEARTLRIRGYGDGIVAQVAAEFIKAYVETTKDPT